MSPVLDRPDAGHGEIEFGTMHLDLDVAYGRQIVVFRFARFDKGDEVRGDGAAEIADDGTLEIEIHCIDGDEPTLIAQRETSSAA